jgi:hypothetical protein
MTKIPLLLLLLLLLSVINHAYQIENNKFEIKKTGPPSFHQNICNRLKTGYNYKGNKVVSSRRITTRLILDDILSVSCPFDMHDGKRSKACD